MTDKQSKLRELAADHWESSRDPGAKHPHIWQALAELAQAVAAEVERIDARIAKNANVLGEESSEYHTEIYGHVDNDGSDQKLGILDRLADIERRLGGNGHD